MKFIVTALVALALSFTYAPHADAKQAKRHSVSVFKGGKPGLGTITPGTGGSCPKYGVWVKNPKC